MEFMDFATFSQQIKSVIVDFKHWTGSTSLTNTFAHVSAPIILHESCPAMSGSAIVEVGGTVY
jgi:hypothetical protein